jgi:hypothetical protein
VAAKVQAFSKDNLVFLAHDFDSVSQKPKKLDYYNIIYLFNPTTKSRPHHGKDDLIQAFKDEVRPMLKPFILPPPPTAMETDSSQPDFDPLSRKTTRSMLTKAILSKDAKAEIAPGATIDDILILYKYYVDPALPIPANNRFFQRPRIIPVNRLNGETIEDLLLALRYLAPSVFVRSLAMNKRCLVNLYIQFVHDETPSGPLIEGYHYTILNLSPSDLQAESKCKIQVPSCFFLDLRIFYNY